MSIGIDLRGKDQVINQFDLFSTPYYCVMQGKDIKFYYADDNMDEARELLENNLNVLEQNGSVAPFKIVYYTGINEKGKLVAENIKGSNTFRVCSPGMAPNNPMYQNVESGLPIWQSKKMSGIDREELEELKNKIQYLEDQNEELISKLEESEEAIEQPAGIGGLLNGLLQNPEIQTALIGRILGFVDTLLPQKNNYMNSAQIAGTEDNNFAKINLQEIEAVEKLKGAGMTTDDLCKLANISVNNSAYFNMLLNTLRSL